MSFRGKSLNNNFIININYNITFQATLLTAAFKKKGDTHLIMSFILFKAFIQLLTEN